MINKINDKAIELAVGAQTSATDMLRRREGQTSTEYLVVLLVVVVAGFFVWRAFGQQIVGLVNMMMDTIDSWNA